MSSAPLAYQWTGEEMKPLRQCVRAADREFVVGEVYRLAPHEDRSTKTHNHQFGWLNEAWKNLPEHLADDYPSAEHLRKRALIQAGFYNEDVIDAGSNAAALRVASYLKGKDDFALVIVRGPFVVVRTAKSQSRRAMDQQEFQASKTAVLEVVADMIGVPTATLARQGVSA